MKRPATAILSATLLVLGSALLAPAQTEQSSAVVDFKASIVSVTSYDQSGKVIAKGNGVFVTDAGDVITNLHLIQGAARSEIRTSDGKVYPIAKGKAEDKEGDLVWVTSNAEVTGRPLRLARNVLAVGEKVTLISTDRSLNGQVSAAEKNLLQTNISLSSDFSGSPIINSKGEILGMVGSKLENGKTKDFITSGETLTRIVPTVVYVVPGGSGGAPYSFIAVRSDPSQDPQPLPGVTRRSGVLMQGSAISRVEAVYPPLARAAKLSGSVSLELIVDEEGSVIWTRVVSGHPLLRDAATTAARGWKFSPTKLDGEPVKVLAGIILNFTR